MASDRRLQKIKEVVAKRQSDLVVVLEDIHDPHNAEAIFRSCDAFGVQEVYLIFDQEKPFNPQKVGKQSSSSANKWLTFHTFNSSSQCLEHLKEKGYFLVATTLQDGVSVLSQSLVQKKLALLVGNEHRGLSKATLDRVDIKLTIPMNGMVESLNVSVATALFLFEIVRQRVASKSSFSLSSSQQQELIDDFSVRSSKRQKRV